MSNPIDSLRATIGNIRALYSYLKNGGVDTSFLADKAVTTDKLALNSVGENQLSQDVRDSISRATPALLYSGDLAPGSSTPASVPNANSYTLYAVRLGISGSVTDKAILIGMMMQGVDDVLRCSTAYDNNIAQYLYAANIAIRNNNTIEHMGGSYIFLETGSSKAPHVTTSLNLREVYGIL